MTSNCDVTNSALQIQMTTMRQSMNSSHENFLRTQLMTASNCFLNLMQKFQAYLKIIISTFQEQPLRTYATT